MRFARWLAPLALVGGMVSAVAFGGELYSDPGPLPTRNLVLGCTGPNTALSYDGTSWCSPNVCDGLALLRPTYVRGPACISVHAGTCVQVPDGTVVWVDWDPSARGWRFMGVSGQSTIHFENTCVPLCPCDSVTLLDRRDVGPYLYRPTGVGGHREVSGFEPFGD